MCKVTLVSKYYCLLKWTDFKKIKREQANALGSLKRVDIFEKNCFRKTERSDDLRENDYDWTISRKWAFSRNGKWYFRFNSSLTQVEAKLSVQSPNSKKNNGVWDHMSQLTISAPESTTIQHIYHGQPYAGVYLNAMPESTYPPVRDLGFGFSYCSNLQAPGFRMLCCATGGGKAGGSTGSSVFLFWPLLIHLFYLRQKTSEVCL
jgi:hypothetical protein